MGVLHSFVWNYVKYANMEGFEEAVTCYELKVILWVKVTVILKN